MLPVVAAPVGSEPGIMHVVWQFAAWELHNIMQFVTFEDEDGLVEGVLFPGTYAALGDPVANPGPFLVGGRVAEDDGDLHLLISEVTPFHRRPRPYQKDPQ